MYDACYAVPIPLETRRFGCGFMATRKVNFLEAMFFHAWVHG